MITRFFFWVLCLGLLSAPYPAGAASSMRAVDATNVPDWFVWSDTCNVYVLRDGESALLIDIGDGSVLDHLSEIGVKKVDWVLFTHHHREQCQGASKLSGTGTHFAGPEAERVLFEKPAEFRKMNVNLGDAFTIHGSSFVRPPIRAVPLERTFSTNDTFAWHGHEFVCIDTRGNSPGGMSYLVKQGDQFFAFSGDLMLDGGTMHTWFDSEWDYGFGIGIEALRASTARMAERRPVTMFPSHGPPIRNPAQQLKEFGTKLDQFEKLYVRGYGVEGGSAAYQDKVSTPTVVSNLNQVSPHLFKFKRTNFWPNFGLILATNGHALVVDCGLLDESFLDAALDGMRTNFGLKAIDAVIISHMHGDHFLEAPHLREKWGSKIWALENMVDKMEHPEWFDYAASIQAYGKQLPDGSRLKGVRVDRALAPGTKFNWEEYEFTVDWMPGQTEFALCLWGEIDGRKVAFTGDNIFGDPDDVAQTGHEAMVAHNSAILEEGYIVGAEYLKRLNPDILIGGHSFVMDHPKLFIERYRNWAYEMRAAFQSLCFGFNATDYRYWFDPFWVRAQPYRITVKPGQTVAMDLHLRNFLKSVQSHRIEIHLPPGLSAEPAVMSGDVPAESRRAFSFQVKAAPEAVSGIRIVAFDVTIDGVHLGEWFDMVVQVSPGNLQP